MASSAQPSGGPAVRVLFTPDPSVDTGLKILVVDDEPLASRAICRMLCMAGYTALHAAGPAQAVSLARAARPDAALVDLNLGSRVDGLALCRGLRRRASTRHLPLLMMTGMAGAEDRQLRAVKLDVREFLAKPFSRDDLLAALDRALASGRAAQKPADAGRILIVDDDPEWPALVAQWLRDDGHDVEIVRDPAGLIEKALAYKPDCAVLDYLVGDAQADELCRRLRAEPELARVPVIVHSAHPEAKSRALEAGAVQFVGKALAPEKLVEAVNVCLRTARQLRGTAQRGRLTFDSESRSVTYNGKAVRDLPRRLFQVLAVLAENPGIRTRAFILDRLPDVDGEKDREVDTLIRRLRVLLKKHFGRKLVIMTVHGCGYSLVASPKQ